MNVQIRVGHLEPDIHDVELTEEELEQVVGGLDRGWWPDLLEGADPSEL